MTKLEIEPGKLYIDNAGNVWEIFEESLNPIFSTKILRASVKYQFDPNFAFPIRSFDLQNNLSGDSPKYYLVDELKISLQKYIEKKTFEKENPLNASWYDNYEKIKTFKIGDIVKFEENFYKISEVDLKIHPHIITNSLLNSDFHRAFVYDSPDFTKLILMTTKFDMPVLDIIKKYISIINKDNAVKDIHQYIAIDTNGAIKSFISKPHFNGSIWESSDKMHYTIEECYLGECAKYSLMSIKEILDICKIG